MSDWWGTEQPTRTPELVAEVRALRSTVEAIHQLVRLGVVLFVVLTAAGVFAWLLTLD